MPTRERIGSETSLESFEVERDIPRSRRAAELKFDESRLFRSYGKRTPLGRGLYDRGKAQEVGIGIRRRWGAEVKVMSYESACNEPKVEQELAAVAKAERDPDTAMAEGKKVASDTTQPTDPLNPNTHDSGENYLGKKTIFTRPKAAEPAKP